MENASSDYLAFLDADNYFLPDRFRAERELFRTKPNIDGVYGMIGQIKANPFQSCFRPF
ncbi:glycosyltransferase family 2 protein [Ginsengibacter hankyongi]|uniref:Glycosyltransferase family 2 protein n=1 Tax=Ginsengibacter hankyongi TaxID=2607284 RepID=A0A5J5IGN5_9BACT|nr:glycosyltransferase family 2 protein [Ginsengibacter hankyongi]